MELKDLKGSELLEQLNSGKLSVLRALGAPELVDEMKTVGTICCGGIRWACKPKSDKNIKKRAVFVVRLVGPGHLASPLPQLEEAMVLGFNHPSLGEILRLLYLSFEAYPDRWLLFPVNIPWYEALVPVFPQMERLKVRLVPMITPSTEDKLNKKFANNEEKLKDIKHLKSVFERNYMKLARSHAEEKGVILVAPSATRQASVIGDHIHPTMTLLARTILRNNGPKTSFIPITVVEPKRNDRKLNALKKYDIIPCEGFSCEEVKEKAFDGRDFDLEFLQRIDKVYQNAKKNRQI